MFDLKKLDISFRDLSRAFQVPKEWVLFERGAILTLGLCTELDPNMNPIHTVGPYLQQFVLGKDADVKGQVTNAVREMAMSAIAIPDKTNRLLERANRGEVQFQIGGLRESALLLYAAVHQILFAFLGMALGVLAFFLDGRGQDGLSAVTWVASALCLVAVAGSILRARALSRKLRSRPPR
jgi:predicted unusual protein kinase regulating ubiquinone biosynthesis (AarF/ABC1/UbiB family)